MLAKIFAILLGIIAVATATRSPALPEIVPIAVIATSTSDKIKSDAPAAKATTTPVMKIETKKSEPAKKPIAKPIPAPKNPEAPLPIAVATSTPPPPPVDWGAINQKSRGAIVNILCTSLYGGSFEPLSASGVIIDPRGIILTNAHVAQYLLLQDYRIKNFLTCVGRTGSPATPAYTLKLLYISPKWLEDNYKNITSQHATGTGENDFALLQITGNTDPDLTLKTPLPFLATENDEALVQSGGSVVLAGYPAGFLGGIAIQRDLYIVSSIINVGQKYTFKTGALDAFSLGGSPVAQHGSSGGAVVNSEGKLLGIIVTSTDAKDTSARDLDALSIAHINRGLQTEAGLTFDSLLTLDMGNFSSQFDEKILPNLKKLLFDELDSKNR